MSTVPKPAKDSVDNSQADGKYDEELLEQIDACQNEIDAMNANATDEILKVEQKYNKLREPCYERRQEHIKRVPNFWMTAIMNHPKISSVLDEDEEECLHSLSKLEVEEFEDIKSGYRVSFHFDENPYFENNVLTKEFHLETLSNSTPIQWKEGKNLLKQILEKPPRPDKKPSSMYKSFFDWFSDDTDIVDDKIGLLIRDELWQNPLQYYQAPEFEEDVEDNGGEGEGT